MVICPIARAVHCTGCMLVKICPAKSVLGDYGKESAKTVVLSDTPKPITEAKAKDCNVTNE
jgi:hypothetical protein